jgi:hypothetical protein
VFQRSALPPSHGPSEEIFEEKDSWEGLLRSEKNNEKLSKNISSQLVQFLDYCKNCSSRIQAEQKTNSSSLFMITPFHFK